MEVNLISCLALTKADEVNETFLKSTAENKFVMNWGAFKLTSKCWIGFFLFQNYFNCVVKSLLASVDRYQSFQWKRISHKQSVRWQYLSWLKASAFSYLQNVFSHYETQQLILGIGHAHLVGDGGLLYCMPDPG